VNIDKLASVEANWSFITVT